MVWREADLLECEISSRCVRDGRAGCFDAGMTLCLNGIKNCVDLYEHCCTSISSKNPYLDTCYKSRKANRYPYRTLIRRVRTLVDRWESQRNGVGSAVASPSSRDARTQTPFRGVRKGQPTTRKPRLSTIRPSSCSVDTSVTLTLVYRFSDRF